MNLLKHLNKGALNKVSDDSLEHVNDVNENLDKSAFTSVLCL